MAQPRNEEEIGQLLDQARVFKVSEEYYAARDESEALEMWRSQTGESLGDLEAEPIEMDEPQTWQGESFTWRELVREAIQRGNHLPCWVGSTYD